MRASDNVRSRARVGLISDTHGVLDPRVHRVFAGVDAIVHAGDVGKDAVLYELEAIAPHVVAVLGNCDLEDYGFGLRLQALADFGGARFLVIHDSYDLGPIPEGVDVIVCGHTHRPQVQYHGNVLVVNPGSASQRRRMPSRTVAIAEVGAEGVEARIVQLDDIAPTSGG